MKVLVGTPNMMKALLGAFSGHCEASRRLVDSSSFQRVILVFVFLFGTCYELLFLLSKERKYEDDNQRYVLFQATSVTSSGARPAASRTWDTWTEPRDWSPPAQLWPLIGQCADTRPTVLCIILYLSSYFGVLHVAVVIAVDIWYLANNYFDFDEKMLLCVSQRVWRMEAFLAIM